MAETGPPTSHPVAGKGTPQGPSARRLKAVQFLTIFVISVALVAAVYFRDRLQEIRNYGYLSVFIVGLVSNATVILPVPGLAISSVMGGVFNPWIVGVVGGAGQALGEMTGYLAGYSGQTWVSDTSAYERLSRWMKRYGAWSIFLLAVVPNPLFDLGGIVAGALRFPVWKFLVSCAAGKIAKNILFALAGYYGIEWLVGLLAH
jgi:membrane protein YqaA with SNARE-associated domain